MSETANQPRLHYGWIAAGLACLVAAAMSLMIGRKLSPQPVVEGAAA